MVSYNTIKNIVIGKLVDKTIDTDYEDLSEILFGEGNCFNSSEVRKRMYGMRTVIEAIDRETLESIEQSDVLAEIKEESLKLKKERQKFFDERRELTVCCKQTNSSHVEKSA